MIGSIRSKRVKFGHLDRKSRGNILIGWFPVELLASIGLKRVKFGDLDWKQRGIGLIAHQTIKLISPP